MSNSPAPPDPERYQLIKRICVELMELNPERRAAEAMILCRGDDGLLGEVRSRLASVDTSEGFMEQTFADRMPAPVPVAGTRIGHYELQSEVGRGGVGIVFRAHDLKLNRTVALKYIPRLGVDPASLESSLEEARAASVLNHPHVVAVYEFGECEGGEYIVMEFVAGGTLSKVIDSHKVGLKARLRYAMQIAEALATAHDHNILHRDVKPANILLTPEGTVKLADFGIAKPMSSGRAEAAPADAFTERGVVLGTMPYMSPEQVEGGPLDARSDIFSLGSVLYELITRRRPFKGDTPAGLATAILLSDPAPPSSIDGAVPASIDRLVAWCLRKNPAQRIHSAADVRLLLESALEEMDTPRVLPATRRWIPVSLLIGAMAVAGAWTVAREWGTSERFPAIRRLTAEAGLSAFPSLSADGTMLAYASDRAGRGDLDIWVRHLSGLEPTQITSDPADDYDPSLSRDGAMIVFRSDREGGGLYVVPAVGGRARRINRGGYRPRLSPDGEWVLFWDGELSVGTLPGSAGVRLVSPHDGQTRNLSAGFAAARYPVWAPDGKKALFLGKKAGSGAGAGVVDWWLVTVDGKETRPTGILEHLQAQGLSALPSESYIYPEMWADAANVILFSVKHGDATSVWELPLDRMTGRPSGKPRQRTFGLSLEVQAGTAALDRRAGIVFSTMAQNVDVYSLPMDTNKGVVTGDLSLVTQEQSRETYPSISLDGGEMAYISTRLGIANLWMRDALIGNDTPTVATRSPILEAYMSASGRQLVYSQRESKSYAVYLTDVETGVSRKVCADCGAPTHISANGEWVMLEPVDLPHSIVALNTETGSLHRILHSSANAEFIPFAARLSPDSRWLAFHARTAAKPARQIMVAPFRGPEHVGHEEWGAITDGTELDREACWSPEGNVLYFLSDRDGFRCIWSQKLEPRTKAPVGVPKPIYHFHHKSLSIAGVGGPPSAIGLSASRNALVFSLNRITADVWSTK